MKPYMRKAWPECSTAGCDELAAATFDANSLCGSHSTSALERGSLPTAVWDWQALPNLKPDPSPLAASLDEIVTKVEARSVVEDFSDTGHILSGALSLEWNWETARPKDRWLHWVPCESNPQHLCSVVLTRKSHRLPVLLLSDVASLVQHPRARAFLNDILWCVTGKHPHALAATQAHKLCATDTALALEHRGRPARLINADPSERQRDLDLRTRQFQLSHLHRGLDLAHHFGLADIVDALRKHAHSLLGKPSGPAEVVAILDASAPRRDDVPAWWDSVAEAETRRIEKRADGSALIWLDKLIDIRSERATATKNHPLVAALRRRQVLAYFYAADNSEAASYMRSGWLRKAADLAGRHVPDLVRDARARYSALDPKTDLKRRSIRIPVPDDLVQAVPEMVAQVASMPSTAERLTALSDIGGLFSDIYKVSDQYVTTPLHNAFMSIEFGPNEQISASECDRIAHARREHVAGHLRLWLEIFGIPMLDRILKEFIVTEKWPADSFTFFDDVARARLVQALGLGRDGDWDTAVHLLAPLIERVVRRVAETTGARARIPAPPGGGRAKAGTLGVLLQALAESGQLPAPLVAGLLFVSTPEVMAMSVPGAAELPAIQGLNLRNTITHSIADEPHGQTDFLWLILCVGKLGQLSPNGCPTGTARAEAP